jgi:DNA-3-methyladenine glycosylase II
LRPSKTKSTRARSRKPASPKQSGPKQPALTQPLPAELAASATKPLVHVTEEFFAEAIRELTARDADLARVVEKYGVPPLWVRDPGFPTLVYIILEQQVSLASARALYQKLEKTVRPFTPEKFLQLTEVQMRQLGFSRQKSHYTRLLADAINQKQFDLDALHELHEDHARERLVALKGIGRWTSDIYLLSALRRPDIWPTGDLALATAVQEVKNLRKRPSPEKLEKMSAPWKPFRAIAARLFWHAYLSKRGQNSATISL